MNADRIEFRRNSVNDKEYILYLMTSSFRSHNNHSLEHALELVHATKKPLVMILYKEPEENPRNNELFLSGIANYEEVFLPITADVLLYQTRTQEQQQQQKQHQLGSLFIFQPSIWKPRKRQH